MARRKEKRAWSCLGDGQRRKSPRLSNPDGNENDNHSCQSPLHSDSQGDGALRSNDDELWLPQKNILELVLDTLQRRDTFDIFSEPVDPREVEDYYEIIKEPMDFGTMRAKLHEGMYKNLQQFKHDVFLIFGNALHFNSSTTVYFRQARALEELAKEVFFVLKTDPENFILEFTATRRKFGKTSDCVLSGLTFKPATEFGPNSRRTVHGQKGCRRQSISCVNDRRFTYQPWMCLHDEAIPTISPVYDQMKSLVCANQVEVGYEESLMLFVKDLGATAHRVATSKLRGLRMKASTSPDMTVGIRLPTSTMVKPPLLTHLLAKKAPDKSVEGSVEEKSIRNFSPSRLYTKTTEVATFESLGTSSGVRDDGNTKNRITSNDTMPSPVKKLQADNLDMNQIRAITSLTPLVSCSKAQVTPSSGLLGAWEFNHPYSGGHAKTAIYNMVAPSSVSSQFMFKLPFLKPMVRDDHAHSSSGSNGKFKQPK